MKKLVLGSLVFLTAVIIFGIFFFQRTTAPYYQARDEASTIAQEQANIQDVEDFYWFNGAEETYFTVTGTNNEDTGQVVIIRQSDGAVAVYDQSEIVSETEAVRQVMNEVNPETILEARIGMDSDSLPVWEVSYKNSDGQLGYYLLSLKTGEWVRTIDNI